MKLYAPNAITFKAINQLKEDLVSLRQKIEAIRSRMAPLKEKMERAYQEYQAATRPLFLRVRHLEDEIKNYKEKTQKGTKAGEGPIDGSGSGAGSGSGPKGSGTGTGRHKPARPKGTRNTKEAERKEQLLEFLVWVLDDQVDKNRRLVGDLTEMNEEMKVQLADMLELTPTTLFDKQMGDEANNLRSWHERLSAWHEALARRAERLEQEELKQHSGDKYTLFQQYEKGPDVWQAFIENVSHRFRIKIQQLEAELRELD